MSGETRYRFIEPSDSEACADLMARNRFFFGGLDPNLCASRYDLVQKIKGLIFGVCAEIDGEVIAMICTYRAGADRCANPHQVFVSALLVDAAYRKSLYSFLQLYRMMLRRVLETMPQVRELVMEVYKENLPSLYMQRMFGSVIADADMPNPEELFMRNFGPSLQRFFRPMWETTHQKLETALPPFDKKKVKDPTPLTQGRLVPVTNLVNGTSMTMFCNLYSGCVCRVRSDQEFFAGLEGEGFFIENLSDTDQSWSLTPYGRTRPEEGKYTVRVKSGERLSIGADSLPSAFCLSSDACEDEGGVVLSMDGTTNLFYLKAGEDWTSDPYNPEPADEPGEGTFSLKKMTGLLAACDGGRVCFQEVWTYVTSPYLFGTVTPDPERKITVRETDDGVTAAYETRRGFRLERTYAAGPEEASIQTTAYLDGGSEEDFDPVFAIHIQDMNGSAVFRLKSGMEESRTFDYVRDLKLAHDEVILYEFVQEDYANQEFEKIILNFEGSSWEVATEMPFRAYLHSNYIFLRPLPLSDNPSGWAWKEGKADFGAVSFRRINTPVF